jgi:hypothetical protein
VARAGTIHRGRSRPRGVGLAVGATGVPSRLRSPAAARRDERAFLFGCRGACSGRGPGAGSLASRRLLSHGCGTLDVHSLRAQLKRRQPEGPTFRNWTQHLGAGLVRCGATAWWPEQSHGVAPATRSHVVRSDDERGPCYRFAPEGEAAGRRKRQIARRALLLRAESIHGSACRSDNDWRAASRGWPGHSPRGINASKTRNAPRLSVVVPARAIAAGAGAAADGSNSSRSPSASVPALATLAYTPRQWSA